MATYKLVALDMDGTLLNDQQEVSETNRRWIRKAMEAGVIVCFSTGRGFRSALPYAEQLGLMNVPMVTVNGSEIWSRPHVLHRRTLVDPETIRRLHRLALQYPEVWYWAYSTEAVYNKETWINPADDYAGHHWLKFGYYTEDDRAREAIFQEVASWGNLEITNSSPWNLEMNPLGITKASALRELCTMLKLDISETVAVGDSLNDIAAIREAGLGVAMGNAQDEVKRAANVVTFTNEQHGVAEVLRKYVLKAKVSL
ncbi:Cof-type HAD-IIB family hydrolase [Paenibacillus xylaniclasticus]|uniref:Cof-type HAD-IIB family hydrolase n=1 Tax=Paenibacillus xylaniclasticus TaxID=588083 RepID=UPI000FDBD6EE|nr:MULTISPECIES: Cof-type HAD-IIB family hydrolase [Paenibacillus]GFN31223.1 5-amino-6-(5-phospho-D-ribitylamino)uracil phosphatase YcsE [Paenibacillus curdlanolyticus]